MPISILIPVSHFPEPCDLRLWQYYLLTGLRRKLKGNRGAQRLIGQLFRQYPHGFIANVMSRYANGRKAAAYCSRYTGRPPLSERRIVAYDGQQVTFSYQDYRDGQEKTLTLPAVEFLLRLLQHVWPRYQRDVHYYGLYQPARRQAHVAAVVRASRYGDQARPRPSPSGRDRFLQACADAPLPCPACGAPLVVDEVQFPGSSHEKTLSRSPPGGAG